jgi:hypothetical protein
MSCTRSQCPDLARSHGGRRRGTDPDGAPPICNSSWFMCPDSLSSDDARIVKRRFSLPARSLPPTRPRPTEKHEAPRGGLRDDQPRTEHIRNGPTTAPEPGSHHRQLLAISRRYTPRWGGYQRSLGVSTASSDTNWGSALRLTPPVHWATVKFGGVFRRTRDGLVRATCGWECRSGALADVKMGGS